MMLPSDVSAVLQWWLIILFLGIGFLPLTLYLFQKYVDKGYIFSKVIGIGLSTYVVFLFGVLHVTPFTLQTSVILSLLTAAITFAVLPARDKLLFHVKKTWRWFVFEEALFLGALLVWAYIHSFAPDIHGLEKYMDYGFINSILRSEYFPPKDMWFAPLLINYYYFGHLMTAVLTKLSGLSSSITFNLMLSTIFAFCFVETFSIALNLLHSFTKTKKLSLIKQTMGSFLSALLVTLGGNLHILYAFFKQYPVDNPKPFWELPFQLLTFPNEYWYPNATRYIYHTIHEFPIYSWVVADLHGHVLDIPFVLLMIGLLLSLFLSHDPSDKRAVAKQTSHFSFPLRKQFSHFFSLFLIHPAVLILLGFFLAIMYMTNAWDGAIYLLLAAGVIIVVHWQKIPLYKKTPKKSQRISPFSTWHLAWGRDVLLSILLIIASFAIFTMPYNAFFKPFVSGIGVLCSPEFLVKIQKFGPFLFEADHCQKSYWWELLTLYGFFYFFVVTFLVYLYKKNTLLRTDIFVLALISIASLLIIIPEFVYVKDIYPAHYRANTMFKLVFQAFIMLGIASGYIIMRLLWVASHAAGARVRVFQVFFALCTVILVAIVMTYPYIAIKAYYGNLEKPKGLNGTNYLYALYPSDYEALAWLNRTVKGQPVILEAQGDSYTDYGRVSVNTGLPTVLGWTVHEWLWRGSYNIPAPRIAEIQKIYETTDVNEAKTLLEKYDVKYVFIGVLEYQKYPNLKEEKFAQLGKIVFQSGSTKIYQIQDF